MEFNTLRNRPFAIAALAGSLGVFMTGCADKVNGVPRNRPPTLETKYYDDGKRQMHVDNGQGIRTTVTEYCDSGDLVEITTNRAITRSVDHPACQDGRLTPADFK